MRTLLLELGAPLVFAFVLLAIAKFIRAVIDRHKNPTGLPHQENAAEPEEEPLRDADETEADPHSTLNKH
jgi:hypothetical protein